MKKTLFTLILSGSIFFSLHAQTFKPTVGFNFTDVTVNNEIGQGKNGWQTGASVAFGEKMYVEPGIFYISKSAEFTDPTVANPVDFSYEWSVTEIQPSFANIDFGKTNGFYGNMGMRLKF